ncbi:hypothetical protein RS3R2_44230 [Pseudomonas lactis]|nr:hypothetical protein RS3R2_44230 [Pseudomonas lactis]
MKYSLWPEKYWHDMQNLWRDMQSFHPCPETTLERPITKDLRSAQGWTMEVYDASVSVRFAGDRTDFGCAVCSATAR